MKKIKLIPVTAEKPEIFEEKVNSYIKELEQCHPKMQYDLQIFCSDGRLLAVFEINENISQKEATIC